MALGMQVGLSPSDFVLDWDQPLPKKGAEPPPQFSAHFYCGQTAACIKMPLGMDVGLIPGDFVLDGDSVPPSEKWDEPPKFRPMFIVANGWMDQNGTLHGCTLQLRRLCAPS